MVNNISYFPTKLALTGGRGVTVRTCAWSQSPGPALLAVSYETKGAVTLFTEDADVFHPESDPAIKHPAGQDAIKMSWSPAAKLLAVGWDDGAVTLWNDTTRRTEETTRVHMRRIACLAWSTDGTHLVSGDDDGKVCVWTVDAQYRGIPMLPHSEPDAQITQVCIREDPEATLGSMAGDGFSFFYAMHCTDGRCRVMEMAEAGGRRTVVCEPDGPLAALLYYPERGGAVVAVTEAGTLTVSAPTADGGWESTLRMKLAHSGGDGRLQVCMAGRHLLASAWDNESTVRMFNLDTEDNFVLALPRGRGYNLPPVLSCLSYQPRCGTLAAGSKEGKLALWMHRPERASGGTGEAADASAGEDEWLQLPLVDAAGPGGGMILELAWAGTDDALVALGSNGPVALKKFTLQTAFRSDVAAIQDGTDGVLVEYLKGGRKPRSVRAAQSVFRLDMSTSHLLVWNSKQAEVFELAPQGAVSLARFPSGGPGAEMAICGDQSVFRVTADGQVDVLSLQGVMKQTLAFEEGQGAVKHISVGGDFLVAATDRNFLRMWRVSSREAKSHGSTRRADLPNARPIGPIRSISLNAAGSKMSFTAALAPVPGAKAVSAAALDSRIFVFDTEASSFSSYDFGPIGRVPSRHCWDADEPRLFACETEADPSAEPPAPADDGSSYPSISRGGGDPSAPQVATLFATPDQGLKLQDVHRPAASMAGGLLGFKVPHLLFAAQQEPVEDCPPDAVSSPGGDASGVGRDGPSPALARLVMPQFVGMEDVDDKTKRALLDFSYYLAMGDMDLAYKAVKLIRSATVWESMAHMCIKTRRADVAELCLANMGHIRAARAAREAAAEPEIEARLAAIAVHLNLLGEAADLLKSADRYDLLNQLHQASGEWDAALAVAAKKDRVHLRSTHHSYGRHLEALGDVEGAIRQYEIAGTHRREVPRLLYELGELPRLETYVTTSSDKEMTSWLARYYEAQENADRAMALYEAAGDTAAQVRVLCLRKKFNAAADLVRKTEDTAAAFQLARMLELHASEREDPTKFVTQAVNFYVQAQRLSQAIRLAKQHGMVTEVMQLGLQTNNPKIMLDCAAYLEAEGHQEKAVLLYKRGGKQARALELCFTANLYEGLQAIADDLGPDSDPALLARCSDFFLQNGQFAKALHLLVMGRQVEPALHLALEHNLIITEEMAETLSPDKTQGTPEQRAEQLRRIAKICKRQGSFHLACKKYTQAGDKLKAMQALLKSGDTEKILFFAGVSRQAEIYVMAANYLQTLNWYADPEMAKSITQLYTKAKAVDSLASFNEAYAQIEIDEYRNYDEAISRLRDAAKYLAKSASEDRPERMAALNHRIALTEKFAEARRLAKSDPSEMVKICSQLLEQPDLESAIRAGDVFAELVLYWKSAGNYEQAYQTLEKMRARRIYLAPYLDQQTIDAIGKAMGHVPASEMEDDGVGEEIDQVDEMNEPVDD